MNQIQCLILTTAHHPDDARLNRHLDALSRRGIRATIVAEPLRSPWRRLMVAPWSAWRNLRATQPATVLLPDPELYVAGALVARLLGIRAVIDIHEDYAAVAADRSWIPPPLRRIVSTVAQLATALGRRVADATIVAADHLRRPGDLVVPNVPAPHFFPDPTRTGERPAAVYVGDITVSRGAHTMVDLLDLVPGLHLELIGSISDGLQAELVDRTTRKDTDARLHISGRLPYREAWERAAGATAGLSLLQDTPAYRSATPTKIWEYMAVGLPVVGTRLPAQAQLLEETGAGSVVGSIEEAADILRTWLADPEGAAGVGAKGRRAYQSRIAGEGGAEALIKAVLG